MHHMGCDGLIQSIQDYSLSHSPVHPPQICYKHTHTHTPTTHYTQTLHRTGVFFSHNKLLFVFSFLHNCTLPVVPGGTGGTRSEIANFAETLDLPSNRPLSNFDHLRHCQLDYCHTLPFGVPLTWTQ